MYIRVRFTPQIGFIMVYEVIFCIFASMFIISMLNGKGTFKYHGFNNNFVPKVEQTYNTTETNKNNNVPFIVATNLHTKLIVPKQPCNPVLTKITS